VKRSDGHRRALAVCVRVPEPFRVAGSLPLLGTSNCRPLLSAITERREAHAAVRPGRPTRQKLYSPHSPRRSKSHSSLGLPASDVSGASAHSIYFVSSPRRPNDTRDVPIRAGRSRHGSGTYPRVYWGRIIVPMRSEIATNPSSGCFGKNASQPVTAQTPRTVLDCVSASSSSKIRGVITALSAGWGPAVGQNLSDFVCLALSPTPVAYDQGIALLFRPAAGLHRSRATATAVQECRQFPAAPRDRVHEFAWRCSERVICASDNPVTFSLKLRRTSRPPRGCWA